MRPRARGSAAAGQRVQLGQAGGQGRTEHPGADRQPALRGDRLPGPHRGIAGAGRIARLRRGVAYRCQRQHAAAGMGGSRRLARCRHAQARHRRDRDAGHRTGPLAPSPCRRRWPGAGYAVPVAGAGQRHLERLEPAAHRRAGRPAIDPAVLRRHPEQERQPRLARAACRHQGRTGRAPDPVCR